MLPQRAWLARQNATLNHFMRGPLMCDWWIRGPPGLTVCFPFSLLSFSRPFVLPLTIVPAAFLTHPITRRTSSMTTYQQPTTISLPEGAYTDEAFDAFDVDFVEGEQADKPITEEAR